MGTVYEVRQPKFDRITALKILRPDPKRAQIVAERFLREARAFVNFLTPTTTARSEESDCQHG